MLKPLKSEVRKPTKTISGITPVAVMLPPRKCNHGNCVYCPSMNVPQSYTPKSPVVMRASRLGYDSYKQVRARLKAFSIMNHPTDKIEIIIMGGTFLEYPEKFQNEFIKRIYDGLNGKSSRTLKQAQKLNERAKHRCVALCVETRPDACINFIDKMRGWGVTRVELGVQIIDDKIYKLVNRKHTVQSVINATRALKNAGFKVGYHIMPGLPGSSLKKDFKLFKKLFSDDRFRPDQLKIYPCQVMPNSELEQWYWKKKYKPYTKEQIEKLLIAMLKEVPRYCRIMRIMREIPPQYIVAGTKKIDLRKDVELNLRKKKIKLNEIRFREIGFVINKEDVNREIKLKVTRYKASEGTEYFLEIVNSEDILFGLCRLRIFGGENLGSLYSNIAGSKLTSSSFSPNKKSLIENLPLTKKCAERLDKVSRGAKNDNKKAIIRELHVYGPALKLGEAGKISQHRGFGKWLIEEAEKISIKNKVKNLTIYSLFSFSNL